MYERVRHVAIRVRELRAAERFYCDLFEMEVAFREGHPEDEFRDLPDDVDWDDEEVAIESSFVERGGVTLALLRDDDAPAPPDPGAGAVDHLNVGVTPAELDRVVARARDLDCEVEADGGYERVSVTDPFGVVWEVTAHDRSD